MPGRQSHGRSLMGSSQPSGKKNKGKNQKSKSKAQAHAQDAYAIAAKQVEPERLTRRGRDLELDPERTSRGGKHNRDEEDDDEDVEEEDERPQKKRARQQQQEDDDEDDDSEGEAGSDSDGNEWHIGVNGDDDDSELDSDEAFGDSDDEKFEGYTFRGSRSQKKADDESDDEAGDDGASLGSDAIDLAAALDQSSGDEDDDDEGSEGDTESGSEEEDGSGSGSDDDEDVDPSKLGELHNLIKDYANNNKDVEADTESSSKQMISLEDLGLSGVKDPLIKKALKLMKKEEQAETTKKGLSKKLDVPLPRRQQDQLLRAAAYEKTNETLDRWNETVKHNRRADHLMFPLPQNAHDAGLDNQELLPLTKKTAGTELEQTIMSIMEESGLGPKAKSDEQAKTKTDANGEEQTISRSELKDLWAQRRKDRELQSREQTRAKRIKKIKSKTYRRIHRKERLGDEADQLEQMRANGEINSDEEREAAHRRRALERVGAKHKESKWAKMGSKVGRAVWDDDYRAGLTDMARWNEELRRRVEGKGAADDNDDDESDASSASGDEDGTGRLLKKLEAADQAEDDEDHPHSGLLSLKFMQRAEAQRKKENDELVAEIRRELGSGSEAEEDDTEVQVGRRTFGLGQDKKSVKPTKSSSGTLSGAISNGGKAKHSAQSSSAFNTDASAAAAPVTSSASGGAGQWASTGKSAVSERKKGRKAIRDADVAELELTGHEIATVAAPKKKAAGASTITQADGDDSSDDEIHLPLALRDHELVDRAFAGEDVAAEFEEEKAAIMSEDDEKIISTTMPGWGSWTGDGISKRAQKRNKGKVTTTKKAGIKKKDRKDAKLDKVILNEKRNRKVRWCETAVIY